MTTPPTTNQAPPPPRFLDIHVLHSVPFSNLNRDDVGQPKEAHYGGVTRTRVSSQCLKRTVRKRMERDQVCDAAVRTKRLPQETARLLSGEPGWTPESASVASLAMLGTAGFKPAKGSENRTAMITFLPEDAAAVLAAAAAGHAVMLHALIETAGDISDEASRVKAAATVCEAVKSPKAKGKLRGRIDAEPGWADACKSLIAEVEQILKAKNPIIALMGRMYASLPEGNVDGAVQAAHAITTHSADLDGDYFTTVDDHNPDDETGAGFLDVADYASGVFYKYATVDLDTLAGHMSDIGRTAAEQAALVGAFADRFARCISEAKKRTTAPNTLPSLVLAVARADTPVSYVNAFERPVAASDGYLTPSIRRILDEDAETVADGNNTVGWLYVSRTATDDDIETGHTRVALNGLADAITNHLTASQEPCST